MVKSPMSKDQLEALLETQKRQTKQKQEERQLSHIDEEQLVAPAKQKIESSGFCPENGIVTWYEEPDVFVREPEQAEHPSKVVERPDLICEWKPERGTGSTLYAIELKKRFGKKGLGQIMTYYWAIRNGTRIVDGDKEYEITGEELVVMFIGGIEYKTVYFNRVIEWSKELVEDDMAGVTNLPLQPE